MLLRRRGFEFPDPFYSLIQHSTKLLPRLLILDNCLIWQGLTKRRTESMLPVIEKVKGGKNNAEGAAHGRHRPAWEPIL